jgi:hypothetical protein
MAFITQVQRLLNPASGPISKTSLAKVSVAMSSRLDSNSKTHRFSSRRFLVGLLVASAGTEGVAHAAEGEALTLGLAPGAPQISALPGGVTPAFGQRSQMSDDWRFDIHGFVLTPLRAGIGRREHAAAGQKLTTLHAPPRIPERYESFEHTGVIPGPWVQLNFNYGNDRVTSTVVVAARTVNVADSYFNPPDHIGINDAFLTFRLPYSDKAAFNVDVGAFANSYGNMGEYDLGRYGTPLLFRVGGVGATARGDFLLDSLKLTAEVGLKGQLNKTPVGVEPAGWNGFSDPNVGTSFAVHAHVLGYLMKKAAIGLHFTRAFVQDDRAASLPQNPDGAVTVLGFDTRLTLGKFGHFYAGFGQTFAKTARSVSSVIRVLNAPGGPGLMAEYLGPNSNNGTGSLTTVGAQYDLSIGHLMRLDEGTVGDGPDLTASVFGIFTNIKSDDKSRDAQNKPLWDGVSKFKYGGELSYSLLSWLAASVRYDRVVANLDVSDKTSAIVSPRLIFHSDWVAQDQVVLQYSHWWNGSQTTVFEGYPAVRDPSVTPDGDAIVLSASMWW